MGLGHEQPFPEDFWSAPTSTPWKSDNDTSAVPTGSFLRDIVADLPPGVGMAPEAAIWPLYNEEAEKWDKDTVETQNGGMENLLVFAALFSAVVTAFLTQTLPLLQPDNQQTMVDELRAISSQLASVGSGTTPAAAHRESVFQLSSAAITINLLWASSLFLSLYMSVTAMLVKQWLRVYTTDLPSAPKDRAVERQRRFDGLRKWGVVRIADSLWTWIHVAVALFLSGFVIYLWTLSTALAAVMVAFFAIASINYLSLAAAPIFWPYCPFVSPLTRILMGQQEFCLNRTRKLREFAARVIKRATKTDATKIVAPAQTADTDPSVPSEELILAEEEAVGWLCRTSSHPQTISAVMAACFAWQDHILLNTNEVTAVARARATSLSLPTGFSPPPGAYDLRKLPWFQLRSLLIHYATLYSLFWNVDDRVEQLRADWAWPYPCESIPEEDRFLYYALLCYCSGTSPHLLPPSRLPWLKNATTLLLDGLRNRTNSISLFAMTFFVEFLQRDASSSLGDTVPIYRLEEVLVDIIVSSLSLPVEFLCACKLLWNPQRTRHSRLVDSKPTWSASRRGSPDAMRDFFEPLFESDVHSDLAYAAMILATNELRAGIASCFDPRRGLTSLLKWFRSHGFLYPERQSVLDSPEVLWQQRAYEIQLILQCTLACRRRSSSQRLLRLEDIFDISQLIDVESEHFSPFFRPPDSERWRPVYSVSDLASDAPRLLALSESGRAHSDPWALVICTSLLVSLLGLSWGLSWGLWLEGFPSAFPYFRESLTTWLYWIREPAMFEVLLLTKRRRLLLCRLLSWSGLKFDQHISDTLQSSGVMEMLRSWHTTGDDHEDLMQDEDFKLLIDEWDERSSCGQLYGPILIPPPSLFRYPSLEERGPRILISRQFIRDIGPAAVRHTYAPPTTLALEARSVELVTEDDPHDRPRPVLDKGVRE